MSQFYNVVAASGIFKRTVRTKLMNEVRKSEARLTGQLALSAELFNELKTIAIKIEAYPFQKVQVGSHS
jgi:hypothetical protein